MTRLNVRNFQQALAPHSVLCLKKARSQGCIRTGEEKNGSAGALGFRRRGFIGELTGVGVVLVGPWGRSVGVALCYAQRGVARKRGL